MIFNRRITAAVLAATLLFATAGKCDTGEGSDPPSSTQRNHDTREPVAPAPEANVPAPAADPMACNPGQDCDPTKYVTLSVTWVGERSGFITIYINGQKRSRLKAPKPEKFAGSKYYSGGWQQIFPLSGITSIGLDWAPDAPGMPAQCVIYHNGTAVGDPQGVNGGPCAANWAVS